MLPAASLLNIVDVELIYEGVKYVLQVRAGLGSPHTGRSGDRDRVARSCPGGERCSKHEVVVEKSSTQNEVNNLILTRQIFSYILLPFSCF